ncbi:hypothetical protein MYX78_00790 [Acidobacteria bacterium AH-259-G07]|nr:hypothetical protein [Acidobacteria bacterium AH-259-G07]
MILRRAEILMGSTLLGLSLWTSGCTSEPVVEEEVAFSDPVVEFKREPGKLHIRIGGKPFATYVYF